MGACIQLAGRPVGAADPSSLTANGNATDGDLLAASSSFDGGGDEGEHDGEQSGYQAGFAKLASSGKSLSSQFDPTEEPYALLLATWQKVTAEIPEVVQNAINASDAETQERICKFTQQQSAEHPNR